LGSVRTDKRPRRQRHHRSTPLAVAFGRVNQEEVLVHLKSVDNRPFLIDDCRRPWAELGPRWGKFRKAQALAVALASDSRVGLS
jgi:hypothetical protein